MRARFLSRSARRLALAALVVPGLAACGHGHRTPPEQRAAQNYLTALGNADPSAAAAATTDSGAAQSAIAASLAGLGSGTRATFTVTGLTNRLDTSATASYDAHWKLPGVPTTWNYQGTLPMTKQGSTWFVQWRPGDINPALTDGTHLAVDRTQPPRAALTDLHGAALVSPTPVVTVGVEAGAAPNLAGLAASLAAVPQLQSTAAEIVSAVGAAPKGQFVPIITLRQAAYEQVKPAIYNLPGTRFQSATQLLPPESGFARDLLGSVGPATKERIDDSHGAIVAGDQVGLSGLQLALDDHLRGTPGIEVTAVPDAGSAAGTDAAGGTSSPPGTKIATVTSPVPGKPVQLTLDTRTQLAADATLAAEPLPAAVVVTQPSTGRILAVANSASAPGDIALTGQYPAGSTFKIATYTAEFTEHPDRTQDTPVPCPATVTADGRTFEDENKFAHGSIPYSAAFGYSCNTTAISIADALPNGAEYRAARALGLGASWQLPVDAFAGSMPASATGTEKAAEAIGQGKVLVSPLLMAEMVGASATGKPITPSLVTDRPGTAGTPLDASVTAKMNALLRATVAMPGATAYASLNGLPGEIRGKTGTAEFGTDVPPKSHSWFAGVRGDLAISVFVYGGEQSTTGAVVLARNFFTALPPS